tara:strand:- start:663 stop:923 length:261 start_codon:yes stop_codon:yes gene_type:complete
MTTIEILQEQLKQLKIIAQEQLKNEPQHPRHKFAYTIVVNDHPLGYHEHYTNDLKTAKKSCLEWAQDYGSAVVENSKTFETIWSVR